MHTLSLLFGTLQHRGSRIALCEAFATLVALPAVAADAGIGPDSQGLLAAAGMLSSLNAYSQMELEERDYDLRLNAYNQLPRIVESASVRVTLPLLSHAIHDAELDDIVLKHSASRSITLIVEHAASQLSGSAHHAMLERVLMPALRRGMRLPPERDALRHDLLRLLGTTLGTLPALQHELATLTTPNEPEADFFLNVTHVQMPRRQRALARLRQRIASGAFSTSSLSGYVLPMLRHFVLRDTPKEADVAEEAVQTLRELVSRLPWRPYLSTVVAWTRMLEKQPHLEKRLIRSLVATIDAFHFDLTVDKGASQAAVADAFGEAGAAASTECVANPQRKAAAVMRAVRSNLLPGVRGLHSQNADPTSRVTAFSAPHSHACCCLRSCTRT